MAAPQTAPAPAVQQALPTGATTSSAPSSHSQPRPISFAQSSPLVIRTSDRSPRDPADTGIFGLLQRPPFDFAISLIIPATEESLSASPSHSQFTYTPVLSSGAASSQEQSQAQTLSSSPRRYPTDLTTPIPEECDETESECPNEPATPVSGRQSRDFHAVEPHDLHPQPYTSSLSSSAEVPAEHQVENGISKPPLLVHTAATPPRTPQDHSSVSKSLTPTNATSPQHDKATSVRRPSTRGSTNPPNIQRRSSSFSNKMASLFRRTNSNVTENATIEFRDPNYKASQYTNGSTPVKMTPNSSQQRFSWRRSSTTTRSHTPPSPGSPLEMAPASRGENVAQPTLPEEGDFLQNNKKNRVSTGFFNRGRGRVNFTGNGDKSIRRTKSVERKKKHVGHHGEGDLVGQPFVMVPELGTGMKARRLSLSLPDDFTVDVAELTKEFEYQHKFFGRHGKHLGKGATSKVTLMARKGAPNELYAVKEFRGKKSDESPGDYEKKIKSEYSIAKSLHHPNIVETIRLCADHGRWNHVMEYCSEGDLFSLVSKKYLQEADRDTDRLCLFKQLLQGVNYLHSNGIAHRDIKLENLLITKDSKLKITDFGVSEVFSGIHPGLREAGGQCGQQMNGEIRLCKPGICGSEPYIAPEVLSKQGDYDPRPLDVWSSAIVMIYLLFSANLWERASTDPGTKGNDNYIQLVRAWERYRAKREKNPDLSNDVLPRCPAIEFAVTQRPLRRILLNMLNPDPAERMTISEVVNSRWMKNVECCQLESYDDPVRIIDATKKNCTKTSAGKIYCHNHLPLQSSGHGLPPMPGKAGY
ncbi:kinase domain containing protein [Seiridium cupressi]